MIKALKNKKGMTLTEIIVGGIMFAIFAIAISSILSPMVLAFMRANDFAEYNKILDSVGNQIVSDLVKATGVPTFEPTADNGRGRLTIPIETADNVVYGITQNGALCRIVPTPAGGEEIIEVFPEGFYKGKQIRLEFNNPARINNVNVPGCYSIVVHVQPRAGGNTFGLSGSDLSREYLARPLVTPPTPTPPP